MDPRTGLENLSQGECMRLLSSCRWGRVGVLVDSHPEIFPINLAVVDDEVVFRTDRGTKLTSALRNGEIAIQVDDADDRAKTGWSVMVVGTAELVEDETLTGAHRVAPLEPWAHSEKSHWVKVRPRLLSGRRLRGTERRPFLD